MKNRLVLLLLLISVASVALSQDFAPIPTITGPVVDTAEILTPEQERSLEQEIFALEKDKGSQIAVVTVLTTAPEAIEQYSMRVAEKWKIGRKGADDGVILLIAVNDRAVRIETGYGLEGAIPDAIARRIIDEGIVPSFRTGNFYQGIKIGVDQIKKIIQGEPLPEPAAWSSGDDSPHFVLLFGFGIFLSFIISLFTDRITAASLSAGIVFCISLFIYSVLVSLLYAFVVWVLSLGSSGGRGGRYTYGGGRGGSISSGWSGGWSGGGGSFGGGGASGRW